LFTLLKNNGIFFGQTAVSLEGKTDKAIMFRGETRFLHSADSFKEVLEKRGFKVEIKVNTRTEEGGERRRQRNADDSNAASSSNNNAERKIGFAQFYATKKV